MRFRNRLRTAATCIVLALGPCGTALAQTSSACRGEPTRSAVIAGVVGTAFILGVALGSDRDHRIAADERLPYLWGATWGAVLGSAVGRISARTRCPDLASRNRPLSARAPDCGRAAWSGAAKGAIGGGLAAFLMAPILLLAPAASASASGHHFDFNRGVAVVTGVGVMAGAPFGAYREHDACARSVGEGVPRGRTPGE
jgi:hypothetical protein